MVETCYVLSPPGGPAGPFWGVVSQSGQVIALQILERQHANQLVVLHNILSGDKDTLVKVREAARGLWEVNGDHIISLVQAIHKVAKNESTDL